MKTPPPFAVALALALPFANPGAAAQRATSIDSALVRAVLVAEDRRDSASSALGRALRATDPRIRDLARRARARIADPTFASRDSLLHLAPPPVYADPAWRIRYR